MVVEFLEVERAVDVERAVIGDHIAERESVLGVGTSHPGVVGVVLQVGVEPVEDGDEVERHVVGSRELLAVVERRAEVLDRGDDGVFPCGIGIGIEVFVDGCVRLLYLCPRGALEIEVQVLGEVPAQGEVPVPEELLVELHRQRVGGEVFHVALLQLIVVAGEVGIERHVLRQVVESEALGNLPPLRFRLDEFLERLPCLVHRCPTIRHRCPPGVVVLIDRGIAGGMVVGMAVGEREVGRVVGHGVPLGLYAHPHVGEREVGVGDIGDDYRFHGVAFLFRLHGFEGIVEPHIGVEGVVLGLGLLLGDMVVEGCRHLGLVGEELAQLELCGEREVLVVVLRACRHAIFQSAESLGEVFPGERHGAEVGELHIEIALGSPSSLVVVFLQSQLIHPHLARLDISGEVSHTDNHGLHLAERRVAHDAHLVGWIVFVVGSEELVEGCGAVALGEVALLLEGGEDIEGYVEHVFLGPYDALVGGRIFVVMAGGGKFQRYLILIVVALVVAAKADEDGELVVGEVGDILVERVGVDEHLQPAILAQVEGGVLVHTLRLAGAEVVDHDVEGLLIVFHQLGLGGVLHTRDARREDIVDGGLVVVLLDIHGTHRHISRVGGTGGEVLRIHTPLAAHQVETAEPEHDGFLELREEHTDEADGGEVADGAYPLLIPVERYAELVPCHLVGLAIAQRTASLAAVDDEVAAHDEVLRTDGDMILVVFLILVEREVLVDVLDIGRGLVRCVVTLFAVVGVGGVALRVVDAFIALQDGGLHLVVVAPAEIVVVVVGRVAGDAVVDLRADLCLHGTEVVAIGIEGALLVVVETVEANVLETA